MIACAGIDYGSKKAGTTAITFINIDGKIVIKQTSKNQDADRFLLEELAKINPLIIAIDAPLSVPPGILGIGDQYFYRQCDRTLKAMSPMFLGGLTARAMAIKKALTGRIPNVEIYETYPKAYIQKIGSKTLKNQYKKDLISFTHELNKSLPTIHLPILENWHQADSILAFLSALRINEGKAITFGVREEGLIYL